jgi:hypothetical protein
MRFPSIACGTAALERTHGVLSEIFRKQMKRPEASAHVQSKLVDQTPKGAIHQLRARRDGNLPSPPGNFPDTPAAVVRTAEGSVHELTVMRWGSPPRPLSLKG